MAGGSVSLAMSGGTAGQFKYANLSSPVVLAAGAVYYVVSQETSGGDYWYNYDTTVTTTTVAAEQSDVYSPGGGVWTPYGIAGQTFVPVDFKYSNPSASPDSGFPAGDFGTVSVNLTVEGLRFGKTGIGFQLPRQLGKRYVVESSADLIHWLPLSTIVIFDEEIELHDARAAGANQRFYRVSPMADQTEN